MQTNSIVKWIKGINIAKEARVAQEFAEAKLLLFKIAPELETMTDNERMAYDIPKDKLSKIKLLSHENIETLRSNKFVNIKVEEGWKDILSNFFGMHENWPVGRNSLGCFLVGLPEYPAYFIPAFTQAKNTGDAHELKKGEGTRGLITGGLEGIAVGALVSGRDISVKGLLPYVCLGMAMQFSSSKLFPVLGEKAGQILYRKKQTALPKPDNPTNVSPVSEVKTPLATAPTSFGRLQKQNISRPSTGLRI